MDLQICPACQQSVLDDEAVNCPFCGAAMDGSSSPKQPANRPAAKPTKGSAAAAPAAETEKSRAPRSGTATAKPPAEAKPQDPFAIKSQASKKAIPLRRKPTAKTTYRVVCPMCDTNGFATPAVAGKEVKCPNPSCLMPVFTAPEIKKEAPPPPKKTLFTPLNLMLVAVFLLLAGGGGYFYAFVLNDPKPKSEEVKVAPPKNTTIDIYEKDPNQDSENAGPAETPIGVLLDEILVSGVEAARQRNPNRSKEFCRVLNAIAYAKLGRVDDAMGQLQAFDNLNSGLNFMKIAPLTQIAWHHLRNNDRKAADAVAKQAIEYSRSLPKTGDDAVQQTVVLGTLLIALEQFEEARTLIESRESIQDIAQSAARIALVIEDKTFNIDRSYNWLPQIELASPLAFATTYAATVRGYGEAARKWTLTQTSPDLQAICLAGYAAGTMNASADAARFAKLQTQLNGLEVSEIVRLQALGLALQVLIGDAANAPQLKSEIDSLVKIANGWKVPESASMPDFRSLYEGKIGSPSTTITSVVQSHLLLARALGLSGQPEAAWQQIEKALKWTKALSPDKATVDAITANLDRDRAQLETRLGEEFSISRADARRTAFNQYRKNARVVEERSQQRYDRERQILKLALAANLAPALQQAWQQEIDSPSGNSNLKPLLEQELLTDLLFQLEEAGQADTARQLREKFRAIVTLKSKSQVSQQLSRLLAAGKAAEGLALYNANKKLLESPLLFLRGTCQLAESAGVEPVIEWIIGIPDPIERELSYRLAAAQLTQRGELRDFWKASRLRNLSPTEKCSMNVGLVDGYKATDHYDEPAPAVAEPSSGTPARTPPQQN